MTRVITQSAAEDGFWRGLAEPGLGATTLRAMTYVAFRIGMYSSVRDRIVGGADDEPTLRDQLTAGAITGGVGSALFAPVDVVRLRMQADAGSVCGESGRLLTGLRRGAAPRHNSTFRAFGEIVRTEGAASLYRGAHAAVARATLLSSSQLASYENLKLRIRAALNLEEEVAVLHLGCALISGLIAQTVIQPFDTMRSFLMASSTGSLSALGPLIRTEGLFKWAYRGYLPAMARQGPIMLFQLPLIEQFRALLGVGYL
eukprot:CAMPEP_0113300528 /NCGR_PEP_ID=MMETSP0010_2-20120614/2119_1 /TAXON_ID=216773 ORGANISM="Corethron hystrix, Strain 308" /NCGR_SAMPLE_ID=MMETSP0010_2 /ASSEMBLY_ACC=CAM_ASM_000155 /LENGTH=257 /DNA_ID=CAMNT_0000153965 /DNA_START=62 /DNA_END=835 /DNA_ORIENTATION=+ /assembly_acc=CAM_ASM_000155